MPRSPMLRNLAISSGGAPISLLIPDTLSSTLHLLVSLLYGSVIPVPDQAYLELCSLCTALGLQDWLQREVKEEGSVEKSTGNCKELRKPNKEKRNKVEAKVMNSDGLRCEVCGKKYLNALRPRQHFNHAHSHSARTRGSKNIDQKSRKATSHSEYAVLPSSKHSLINKKLSKTPSPIKVLQCETDVNVGRSPCKSPRSIFLPWKLQEVEEGRVAFRWQQTYFNRGLCQILKNICV